MSFTRRKKYGFFKCILSYGNRSFANFQRDRKTETLERERQRDRDRQKKKLRNDKDPEFIVMNVITNKKTLKQTLVRKTRIFIFTITKTEIQTLVE